MLAEGRVSRRAISSWPAGESLVAVYGDQLGLHAGQLNRLVAVIGDHHEDGQESDFTVMNRENVGLFRQIVGIHRDRNRFHGMLVMRRIGLGRLRLRHDKFLRRQAQQRKQREGGNRQDWESKSPQSHA